MTPADFLCFIGKKFYTRESFCSEAAHMGISRRVALNQIPEDLVAGKSKLFFADEGGHDPDKPSSVFGYCIPDGIEYIGGTDEDQKLNAHIISRLKLRPDTKIIGTVEGEEKRGCGIRKVGGSYIVVDKADSPMNLIHPPAKFDGNHFRGLMRLTEEQSEVLQSSGKISVMRETQCMMCGEAMRVPPSTLKRAAKALKHIEEGIGTDWQLECVSCKSLLKAAS